MTTVIQENRESGKVKDLYFQSPVVVREWFSEYGYITASMEERDARSCMSENYQTVRSLKYKHWFDNYKKQFRCVMCKNGDPEVLDFHHRDPKEKKYSISTMICQCMRPQDIQAELKKCIAVCLHCHRKIHNRTISKDEVMKKAKEEYYIIGNPRPGEDILEDFCMCMLKNYGEITIVSKYDEDDMKRRRILHNFKETDDDIYLEKHPDYVNFCKKRIETQDPEVDMELYRDDDLGEFYRGDF